ncbi:MAG: benzoate 1,2-dioxygenase large subunit [Alphaproteobacteria bacterium]|nr:benzoate 1,2-dioxygenase large subunit [Alphaproteobacteria bacterium]
MTGTLLTPENLLQLKDRISGLLINDPAGQQYKLDRDVFRDETIFELEMKYIFEGNWVFAAHESQLAKPNDFLTTTIGRQPVVLTRMANGEIGGFLNVCAHRGARVCREKSGNKKVIVCGFHGWSYDSAGTLINVTDEKQGAYPESFDRSKLGLTPIARVENYRGFIFASLNPDVLPLTEYLAGSKTFIDLFVDQSPTGKNELLRGVTRYTYKGNWKLQMENGLDGYHAGPVHASYILTAMRRVTGESKNDTKVIDLTNINRGGGGFFVFEHGHTVLWIDYPNYKDRPNYEFYEDYQKKFGAQTTFWMCERLRNMLLFPNVFLMDQTSTQIRIIRPVSVDETEITTYCIAPVGESDAARARRIRQYEDFFNASGMATPDDLTEFNNCQIGFNGRAAQYSDLSRGAGRWIKGVNEDGPKLGFDAVMTGLEMADEGLYIAIHDDWMSRMNVALAKELAAP